MGGRAIILPIVVNIGTHDLVPQVKRIADSHRNEIGFTRVQAFIDSVERQWLLVAQQDEKVIGYVRFRHRRDGLTTLYEIIVSEPYRRKGVASSLVEALYNDAKVKGQTAIQLKCPERLPANEFYADQGFEHVETSEGKRIRLKHWRCDII